MKTTRVFFITLSILSIQLRSQTKDNFEKHFNEAEKLFSQVYQDAKSENLSYAKGGYAAALPLLLKLYKQEPANKNLAFKIGICYLSSRKQRALAIFYLSEAVTSVTADYHGSSFKEQKAPLIADKFLADAYHLNYQFDIAIETYFRFINELDPSDKQSKELIDESRQKVAMCKTGKMLVENPVRVKIESMGNAVNSAYADYSPVLSADLNTLFFTSRRPESKGGLKDEEGNFMEDIYLSHRSKTGWTKAVNIGAPINSDYHEATVGTSADGQTILIYKDDEGDGNIYSTSLEGDLWSTPVKLNDNINSKYWEPSAFISSDGLSIYFSSNRPGGFGGRDIYKSEKTSDGDWGKAVNLGSSINSPFDEDAPFIHHDGLNLSFSSNGHTSMGGFDIFNSLLSNDGIWSEPLNAGYPINTTDDDIFYVVSPDEHKAYLSSFREGGMGEKDNYEITYLNHKESALALMKGTVNDEFGKPAKNVVITVTDNESGKVAGVYHTNSKTGQFLFIVKPEKNYNITYQAADHLFYSENLVVPGKSNYFEIKRAVSLKPITVGSKIVLNNIFFDFDKITLRPLSNVEINNLVVLLKSNPNLVVEISGHTDLRGSDEYNQVLSENRANAVVNRLIEKEIQSERMTAKGYGKTMPIASNKKANGNDDPEGRQLNRRVEFKIVQINQSSAVKD